MEARMLEVASRYLPSVYLFLGFICILGGLAPSLVTLFLPNKYGFILAPDVSPEQKRRKRALGYITMCGVSLANLASVSWNSKVGASDVLQLGVPALVLTAIAIHFASRVWTRSALESDNGGVSDG